MNDWRSLVGLIGGVLFLSFYIYVRRNPDTAASKIWDRLRWAGAATAATFMVGGLSSALLEVVMPNLGVFDLFFSASVYWVEAGVFIAAWFAAPYFSKKMPVSRW
jgi:hypothetical protein